MTWRCFIVAKIVRLFRIWMNQSGQGGNKHIFFAKGYNYNGQHPDGKNWLKHVHLQFWSAFVVVQNGV